MSARKHVKLALQASEGIPGEAGYDASISAPGLAGRLPRTESLVEGTFLGTITAASVSFCLLTVGIALKDPDYFSRELIASFQKKKDLDPIETGSLAASSGEGKGPAVESLPVPVVTRAHEPTPQDYQIIMVFEDEAILATQDELVRVKVGSTVPGLGKITGIESTDTGGTVVSENATLKSVVK